MNKIKALIITLLTLPMFTIITIALAVHAGFCMLFDTIFYVIIALFVVSDSIIAAVVLKAIMTNVSSRKRKLQRKLDNISDYYQYEIMMNPPELDT